MSYPARMSPALNGSSTLERLERSNASEIRKGIMFDFYPGLPHMLIEVHVNIVYASHLYAVSVYMCLCLCMV